MSELRTLVRGIYDIQKLRIQMGNRLVSNFKVKLGTDLNSVIEVKLIFLFHSSKRL